MDAMFTETEIRFLEEHARGRLSTVGVDDRTHVHPVAFVVDGERDALNIIGAGLRDKQKYRNVRHDPRVTLTVDDPALPLSGVDDRDTGRGLKIHGLAEATESHGIDVIRIRPIRVDEWNLDRSGHRRRFLT